MSQKSKIEWCDATWNPVSGCSHVSEGCRNCYAERIAARFRKDHKPWTAANAAHNVMCHPERLDWPLHRRKPLKIFVNSMGDLFHPAVPAKFIVEVFEVMAACPRHTFLVLTKQPERIASVLFGEEGRFYLGGNDYLPNVILGTSVENQPTADDRILKLLASGWVGRFFVSYEPALGPADLTHLYTQLFKESINVGVASLNGIYGSASRPDYPHDTDAMLDWVIAGGESGPHARPAHPDWFRGVRDQCQAAGVPFFFKQHGEWLHESQDNGSISYGHSPMHVWTDGTKSYRVTKKRAGRLLDGREWNESPSSERQ